MRLGCITAAPQTRRQKKCVFFVEGPDIWWWDCEAWKRKQSGSAPRQPKGVGLIKLSPRVQSVDCRTSEATDTCFKPFIFVGFVSLSGKAEDQRPVRILRDTACSQSLILSGVLPLSVQSDVCAVVRGIEMGCVPAPLHQIYVKSGIMTGFFTVGVRSCFPIDGINLNHGE